MPWRGQDRLLDLDQKNDPENRIFNAEIKSFWAQIKLNELSKREKAEKKNKKFFDGMMLNKDIALGGFQNAEDKKEKDFFGRKLITNEQNDFNRRGLAAVAYSGPEMDAGQAAVFKESADYRARATGVSGRQQALGDNFLENKKLVEKARQNDIDKQKVNNQVDALDRKQAMERAARASAGIYENNYGWNPRKTKQEFRQPAIGRMAGGPVPGMGFGDKIPMLAEPGEFVIPQKAAQQIGHGNLAAMSRGDGQGGFGGDNKLATAIMEFNQKVGNISTAFTVFGANVDKLVSVMEKFPQSIEMTGNVTHTHNHNGAEVFAEMKGLFKVEAEEIANKAIDDRVPGANMRTKS